jgi:hypothetical protein
MSKVENPIGASETKLLVISYASAPEFVAGTLPSEATGRQGLAHDEWMEKNAGGSYVPLIFHDDGHEANGPGPGLEKALAVSHKYGPGLFIVNRVANLCRTFLTAEAIVTNLVERGWRFVACVDNLDTAKDPNWQDHLRALTTPADVKL